MTDDIFVAHKMTKTVLVYGAVAHIGELSIEDIPDDADLCDVLDRGVL